jgi:endonuclease/exonuclease/phosphatase family metal-dependent hydrolase
LRLFTDAPSDIVNLNIFSMNYKNTHLHTHDEIILLGDFNINFLDNTNKTANFLSILEDFNVFRLPIDNTHKSHNALTTIDAIFVSAELRV